MTTEQRSYPTRRLDTLRARGFFGMFANVWIRFWMHFAGTGPIGRFAAWLVTWLAPPHYDRWHLRFLNPKGFVSPSATVHGKDIHLGPNIFVDDRALIFQRADGGSIDIGARVTISRDTVMETLSGGNLAIGDKTSIHPHCFFSAAQGSIRIGAGVGIAPYCAFYPHDHGKNVGQPFNNQPLVVKGDIVVEDEVWLGHGVTVLSGARIGKGAVIGAGSTVAGDVPANAVAWGVPAKVFMKRKNPAEVAVSKPTLLTNESKNS